MKLKDPWIKSEQQYQSIRSLDPEIKESARLD
jgi:hypothetical protein